MIKNAQLCMIYLKQMLGSVALHQLSKVKVLVITVMYFSSVIQTETLLIHHRAGTDKRRQTILYTFVFIVFEYCYK